MKTIRFDAEQRLFQIQMRSSYYAFRILDNGQIVHTGSGSLPENEKAEPVLARLGDYVETSYGLDAQARRYELPTFGDISYHDVALKASFPQPSAKPAVYESANLPVRDVRLRYVSHEIRTDENPGLAPEHGVPTRKTQSRETLCVKLKDIAYDFRATLFYRVTPEHDIIERWIELENATSMEVAIEALAFGTLNLPNGEYEVTRPTGCWNREFTAVRQNLEHGKLLIDQQGLNTGHTSNPFFLLNEREGATESAGDVWFGALAYSGNWSLRFEVLPSNTVRVHGGYELSDFSISLPPGGKHRTPAMVHGCAGDGRGGASRRLHRFIREYVLPDSAALRPVLYNSWDATYFDINLEKQLELARLAASIGVELFCIDDGWFGSRRNDRAGLGDWVVSEEIFPGGLKPLTQEVKRLGMKFGLWVEPEMVNPDSDLYRAHPDWVLHFPGRPRTEGRHQLILDFGRPEVVEHMFGVLDALVRDHDVDFFKWDMNRYASEPGSVVGKSIWRKHVEALYSLCDRLRRAHPKLSIQSCSSGGGRVDIGILGRTDQVWASDNSDAHDRVIIEDGFSLAYPPRAMECWVTNEENPLTKRIASLDLRFDVAMRGALGIGSALNRLSAEELDAYKRKIAFYKKIRLVVQEGDLYRLSLGLDSGVSIWEVVLPDASRAVYSIAVIDLAQGLFLAPARLRALDASAVYAVIDESGTELGRYSGYQLMTLGLPGDTASGGHGGAIRSRTLLLERVK